MIQKCMKITAMISERRGVSLASRVAGRAPQHVLQAGALAASFNDNVCATQLSQPTFGCEQHSHRLCDHEESLDGPQGRWPSNWVLVPAGALPSTRMLDFQQQDVNYRL